jgi:hypothetical protein
MAPGIPADRMSLKGRSSTVLTGSKRHFRITPWNGHRKTARLVRFVPLAEFIGSCLIDNLVSVRNGDAHALCIRGRLTPQRVLGLGSRPPTLLPVHKDEMRRARLCQSMTSIEPSMF